MKVVVAVSGWPGEDHVDPWVASRAVQKAWREAAPGSSIEVHPIGDGGPRTADALSGVPTEMGGVECTTLGGATWIAPGHGAVRWDPVALASALGSLAVDSASRAGGPRTVVVPVGDDAPTDHATLLWGDSLPALRHEMRDLDLVVIATSHRPLVGFHGMSAALVDGHESDAIIKRAAQEQERRWTDIALEADMLAARESLIGPTRLSDEPGTGAAGGLAYALAAVGARIAPAHLYLADAIGLTTAAVGKDLVFGVGGELTPATLDSGVAASVSLAAARGGVPATVLSTGVKVGRRDLMAAGLASAHQSNPGLPGLVDGVRRVAQTWVPR